MFKMESMFETLESKVQAEEFDFDKRLDFDDEINEIEYPENIDEADVDFDKQISDIQEGFEKNGNVINEVYEPDKRIENANPERESLEPSDKQRESEESNEMISDKNKEIKTMVDDNGKVYREGNFLKPDTNFEINGFAYQTDDKGRVISAEGKLRIYQSDKKRDMDSMDVVGKGEQKEGDIRFHLIGHRFDGSGGIENLVAGDSKLNQGDYLKLENTLAAAVKEGADVKMKVEPIYNSDSNRPDEFRVSYTIDGEKEVVVFKNGSGDGL